MILSKPTPPLRRIAVIGLAVLCGGLVGFIAGRGSAPPPAVVAVPEPPPSAPVAEPSAQYAAVAFADLPGWSADRLEDVQPALARVCAALEPAHSIPLLMIAGVAWAGAFLGFALAYAPLLCGARKF